MERIGWIGTGVMGISMCDHIIRSGYQVSVFNRTRKKAEKLIKKGAVWCETPREVAEKSDIIFSIVGYPSDVEQVILSENGILSGAAPGSVIVDMTTSKPSLAQSIYQAAKSKSVHALDAPVSGGDSGAREGKLAIMVGGDRKIFDKVLPFFTLMGENIVYMGKAGRGQYTKMCNQILIASTMVGVVESLLFAYKAKLDLDEVINVIGKGAASSWSINNLGRKIIQKDFKPGFFIKHFIKDMGIALDEAKRLNLSLPGLALANQFYIAARTLGFEELGTQGLYKVFALMNDIR